jgi:hypothetical protein
MESVKPDELTSGLGPTGIDHYSGILARNACHFAPYTWYRWQTSHLIARDYAERYFTTKNDESRRLAWLYHGYADHFLQDSFAAGHLINKTLVIRDQNGGRARRGQQSRGERDEDEVHRVPELPDLPDRHRRPARVGRPP